MTESHSDEKLAQLLALHGAEGYGFWWLLVEMVAQHTGKDDNKCSVAYPASYWMRITGFYHFKKLKMLVESMHNLSLIYAQCSSNLSTISALSPKDVLTISMPNILKYRDEYSKKSGQKTESVGAKKEKEKKIENKEEDIKTTTTTRETEIVLVDKSNSQTKMRDCFLYHYAKLELLYPHTNLPAEMETCIAHYANSPVIDAYPVILKWMNRVPKNGVSKSKPSHKDECAAIIERNIEAGRESMRRAIARGEI